MSDVKDYYNERTFLNSEDSHYTGSLVCFDGKNLINQGKKLERYSFVELADCHRKVKIHRDDNLPLEDYIEKIRLIRDSLTKYIRHLENTL